MRETKPAPILSHGAQKTVLLGSAQLLPPGPWVWHQTGGQMRRFHNANRVMSQEVK